MARHWVSLPAPVESCLVGHLSACLLLKYHMLASTQLTCTSFAGFALLWHHLAVAKRLLGRVALYKTMQCADRARTCHRSPAEPGYLFHLILVQRSHHCIPVYSEMVSMAARTHTHCCSPCLIHCMIHSLHWGTSEVGSC